MPPPMSMEEEILEKSTNSVDDGGIRLSQIQLEFKLSKINTKLGYFDNILRECFLVAVRALNLEHYRLESVIEVVSQRH